MWTKLPQQFSWTPKPRIIFQIVCLLCIRHMRANKSFGKYGNDQVFWNENNR
jgi:hypothetical protein